MKLTDEQKKEKLARDNIRRLINRVSSEYSFRKWRNLRGYLHSIGSDKSVIESTQDKELTRIELDELLRQYEETAFKNLQPKAAGLLPELRNGDSSIPREGSKAQQETGNKTSSEIQETVSRTSSMAATVEEKFTEKNNYGLSKSEKETVSLFWFQRKAAAELLKGFV